jgi:hypothetical protein
MSSFAQLIGRLRAEQRLQGRLDLLELGVDVEKEKQDVEMARAEYRRDVEKAQREMARRAKKRSRRGALGRLLGTALSFIPVVGPIAGAAIGGIASGIGRGSVSPYMGTIRTSLPGGKFLKNQRANLAMDIESTNLFINDAARSQKQATWYNAIGDALGTYQLSTSLGAGKTKPEKKTEDKVEEKDLGAYGNMRLGEKTKDPYERLTEGSLLGDVNLLGARESTYDYQVGDTTLQGSFIDPFTVMTDDDGNVDLFGGRLDAAYMNRIFGGDRRNN